MNDINYNYNLKRHLELINQQKSMNSQNKSFFKENPTECSELMEYNIAVEQHIFWEGRFKIASVVQDFLSKTIDAHEFYESVFGLNRIYREKYKTFRSKLVSGKIQEFFPNKEASKYRGFLSDLYSECEHFEMNWNEEEFYNNIRTIFLKFQKMLNEE